MLFSVIVPVYGVEKYLRECVDSILMQNFTDFELILVDDGSKDSCPEICDGYAKKDGRVKVIHKENGGLVSARKAGMRRAEGEYIINIDGDDAAVPGYFEKAAEIICKNSPDIITFAVNFVSGGDVKTDEEPLKEGLYTDMRPIHENMLLTPDMHHMHYFLWAKVFRKPVIEDIQLNADERISMGEDVMCVAKAYIRAKSVFVSKSAMYNCRCREGSMSRAYKSTHFDDIALGVKELKEIKNPPENFACAVDRYAAFMFFVIFATAAKEKEKNVCEYSKQVWYNGFDKSFKNSEFKNISPKSRMATALLKKRRFLLAYRFLRICDRLKGNKNA